MAMDVVNLGIIRVGRSKIEFVGANRAATQGAWVPGHWISAGIKLSIAAQRWRPAQGSNLGTRNDACLQ